MTPSTDLRSRTPQSRSSLRPVTLDKILSQVYGTRVWNGREEPLDGLILTVLSQHTNDINRDRAFRNLKKRFSTWDKVRTASPSAIADAIRVGGLAEVKSHRIKEILNLVRAEFGKLSLTILHELAPEESIRFLSSLPGVGPKTVACVLLFSCGVPQFPVDTHIHRITKRLGWIELETDANRAHELLNRLIPDTLKYQLHLNLITHGRALCRSQRPLCNECPLNKLCPRIGVEQ